MGDTTKVEDQEKECRGVCTRRGWEPAEVYTDNSRSAWQRNRKRPGWDAMLEGIAAGRFGAVVSYWGDRLVRQPRDLEDLLDLRDVRQITLASVAGQYDFDNPDHRMMMRWEVARACNESDTISRRVKKHLAGRRAQGLVRPGGRGGRAFGFATDSVTHVPEEAQLVREAAARVLAGETTGAICRDFTGRGILTPTGRPFGQGTLRKMLGRPRYAGLMPDGVSAGAWEPVLPRDEWEAVAAVLDAKASGFGYATNARRWLLSGIALCGAPGCGSPLQIRQSQGRAGRPHSVGYGCVQPGCRKVYRAAELLDAYVARRVVNRLANPANPAGYVPEGTGLAAEFRALTQQHGETEAAIADHRNGRRLTPLLARLDSIDARLAELRELTGADARTRLRESHAGITADQFAAEPLATRRALVSACFQVSVLPASKRGPGFRTEDVVLAPR